MVDGNAKVVNFLPRQMEEERHYGKEMEHIKLAYSVRSKADSSGFPSYTLKLLPLTHSFGSTLDCN